MFWLKQYMLVGSAPSLLVCGTRYSSKCAYIQCYVVRVVDDVRDQCPSVMTSV